MKSSLRQRHNQAEKTDKNDHLHERNAETKTKIKRNHWFYIFLFVIFILPLALIPILPILRFDFSSKAHFIKLNELPKFEGALSVNDGLKNPQFFLNGELRGAETILFHNDKIYTGLLNGSLVAINREGKIQMIVQIGPKSDESCNDYGSLFESKKECGRPLALRLKQSNWIYLTDSYHGLFKVNLNTLEKIQILDAQDARFNDKPMKFTNDLDLDDEGNIYFTDSSYKRTINEAVELYNDASPTGRLFKYNENTNELILLIDGIRFANGVQLTPEKDAVLVSELSLSRIIKYHLKGPKQGLNEIFVNLPGSADNIRMSPQNTLYIAFALVRNPKKWPHSLLDLLGEYPLVRTIIGSIFNLRKIMLNYVPKYGLIAEYDFNGTLIKSWHDSTGKNVELATCVTHFGDKLYLGSFYHDFITVVDY